jgi:hypothetical protein
VLCVDTSISRGSKEVTTDTGHQMNSTGGDEVDEGGG